MSSTAQPSRANVRARDMPSPSQSGEFISTMPNCDPAAVRVASAQLTAGIIGKNGKSPSEMYRITASAERHGRDTMSVGICAAELPAAAFISLIPAPPLCMANYTSNYTSLFFTCQPEKVE